MRIKAKVKIRDGGMVKEKTGGSKHKRGNESE